MADKKVTAIYRTSDYDRFKFIEGNRDINHARKIVESINEIGMLWQPILVNERFEIIDGQGRFLAMKTLGQDIIYVVQPGLTIKHVRFLNENATTWGVSDYIHSYAVGDDARESYINYEVVRKQFPEFNQKIIMKAASPYGLNSENTGTVKNGSYDGMHIEHMNIAIRRLTKLREFSAFIPADMKCRAQLLGGIIFCIYVSEVDANFSINQLMDGIKKNLDMVTPSRSLVDVIGNLDYMYNYKRSEKNRYYIFRKYEDVKNELKTAKGREKLKNIEEIV